MTIHRTSQGDTGSTTWISKSIEVGSVKLHVTGFPHAVFSFVKKMMDHDEISNWIKTSWSNQPSHVVFDFCWIFLLWLLWSLYLVSWLLVWLLQLLLLFNCSPSACAKWHMHLFLLPLTSHSPNGLQHRADDILLRTDTRCQNVGKSPRSSLKKHI